jgi:hypothetical protein
MLEANGTDGQLKVDNDKISITRKGFLGRLTSLDGGGDEVLPMDRVLSVGFIPVKLGIKGSIQFGVLDKDGKATVTSSNAGWAASLISGELKHAIMFSKKDQESFEKIRDFVNERIEQIRINSPSAAAPSKGSLADEIKKLSDLRDAGILTEEEFNQQKKKLL